VGADGAVAPARRKPNGVGEGATETARRLIEEAGAGGDSGLNPKEVLGDKKVPFRFLPRAALIPVAYVMKTGADKYGWWNWRQNPVKMGAYLEAIERHLSALYDGEDIDPDDGEDHIAHLIATAMVLLDAKLSGMMTDDRPFPGPSGRLIQERRKDK
jgi:hypothetical protein